MEIPTVNLDRIDIIRKKEIAQGAGERLIEAVGPEKVSTLAGEALKNVELPKAKKKGSSLVDFGRGLVEGVLGMPESVEGSSSKIPYALGQLPGTLVRSKVGLQTSGEATNTAMQLPGTRQFVSKSEAELAEFNKKRNVITSERDRMIEMGIMDPITGELTKTGAVPYGSKYNKGVLSPEQIKSRALATGTAKSIEKDIEMTAKLSGAVKRLALLNKQYAVALPTGDNTPLEQRIAGGVKSWASKMGLINNPELLALQKNLRPIAINMIRLFGEVGNLSETEQQGALDTVNQANLTEKERIAATRQFIEYALAGASPESIKFLKGRTDIQGILNAFNVNLGEEENIPKNNPKLDTIKNKWGLD